VTELLLGVHGATAPPALDRELAARRPLAILVADDDAIGCRATCRILERLGYRADVARDGLGAVEAVARRRYDVVLMDMYMPALDGAEATRRIRAQGGEQPWIVGLSGSVMAEERCRCADAGMDDFVAKPFRLAEFVEALERVGRTEAATAAA
jgi:CheY-like chemotaxis protein